LAGSAKNKGLSVQDKQTLSKLLDPIKKVDDFFADAIEAFEKAKLPIDVPETLTNALPWAEAIGEGFKEAVPLVKFIIKVYEKLTKINKPEELVYLACTMAYEQAVQQTFSTLGDPHKPIKVSKEMKQQLAAGQDMDTSDFSNFSLDTALSHPFIRRADQVLTVFAQAVGYNPDEQRILIGGVHTQFVSILKELLSNGETRDKFAPLTDRLKLGSEEGQAYTALYEHAKYQRWLFEQKPVFETEPYALAHVYVNTECGRLNWGEIRENKLSSEKQPDQERKRVDPFLEEFGGRQPLSDTVMHMLADPHFKDAIVIQGAAGSGKSAFTLWICSELLKRGLRPIRILLRDLDLSREQDILEAFAQKIRWTDEIYKPGGPTYSRPNDTFLGGRIFDEQIRFGEATICPYVLILDGWDEISVSVSEGFKFRVERMLEKLRNRFLRLRNTSIRVILTGRPSADVTDSGFLLDTTPILTVRPLRPEALETFVGNLRQVLQNPPLQTEGSVSWPPPDLERFQTVFSQYRMDFEAICPSVNPQSIRSFREVASIRAGSMEVLGLPLLAHLAVRLMSDWQGDLEQLVTNPTTLLRSLLELTCKRGGKFVEEPLSAPQARVLGNELRKLLWQTAEAMTAYGQESISYTELSLRLDLSGEELVQCTKDATGDNKLSTLMISFYFKTGHPELGCEFLHKSFREYIFAEGVIESLKDYGRKAPDHLPERDFYWQDFDEKDERFMFSRSLAEKLTPQWLTVEIVAHLEELLKWEIARHSQVFIDQGSGQATEPLDMDGWIRVRDGLADLWDWWAQGVHLRPQPSRKKRQQGIEFSTVYAEELVVEHAMPLDHNSLFDLPVPQRIITMDGHLGDALFRLCAYVHFLIADQQEWLKSRHDGELPRPHELWAGVSEIGHGPRRCQCSIQQGEKMWVLFSPSDKDTRFFANYIARINGVGWRPMGAFPLGCNVSAIDLRGTEFNIPIPTEQPKSVIVWDYSNLSLMKCGGSLFYRHSMISVLARNSNFNFSLFQFVDARNSDFSNSFLGSCLFNFADFGNSNLKDADISRSDTDGMIIDNANLSNLRCSYLINGQPQELQDL